MQNPKNLAAWRTALTQKVAKCRADGLFDKSYIQVTDTYANVYISLCPDASVVSPRATSGAKPIVLTHADFNRLIDVLPCFINDSTDSVGGYIDNFAFDAVDGDSVTKFYDPNNGMLMDSTDVAYGSYGAVPPSAS